MEKDIENPNASQESREIFAQKRDEFASEIRKKKTNDLIEQKRLRFNQSDQTDTIKQLFCRDHPGEAVRKIHPTCQGVNLYCFECVLGLEKVAKESLLSIEDFLYQYLKLQPQANEISAKFQCIPDGSEEFLGKKTEITTVVASHIEKEKIEVDQALEKLKQTFIDNLEKKRIEISKNLDDQLVVLDFNFELFTEKINACKEGSKKVHTMETLANQINSFEDAKDLEKFLMLLKNDMDENEEFIRLTQEERAQAFQAGLKEMQNTLSGITIATPTINLNNPAFFKGLAAKLEVSTQKSLEEIAMKNKIPKLSITLVRIDSNIILEMSHMKLLKLWLSESDNYSGNFKLLYRGSKDDNNANAFHQKCDDKGPTVV